MSVDTFNYLPLPSPSPTPIRDTKTPMRMATGESSRESYQNYKKLSRKAVFVYQPIKFEGGVGVGADVTFYMRQGGYRSTLCTKVE